MAGLTAPPAPRPARAARRGRPARGLSLALLAAAALAAGCGASATPYNARQACEAWGARYTADGRCQAGGQ